MGMLKKLFNWKTSDNRESFNAPSASTEPDVFRSQKANHSQALRPANAHDRQYHSETEMDFHSNKLNSMSKTNTLTASRILSNQLQEVSSTVVCDYGEMDASSPAVQQVS